MFDLSRSWMEGTHCELAARGDSPDGKKGREQIEYGLLTDPEGRRTWHSLRHVSCTAALNTWKLDVSEVSWLAGHSNTRVTFEMYVGSVAGAGAGPPGHRFARALSPSFTGNVLNRARLEAHRKPTGHHEMSAWHRKTTD